MNNRLVVNACGFRDLKTQELYLKILDVDMRQFKKLRMFLHAEEGVHTPGLSDGDVQLGLLEWEMILLKTIIK